MSAGPIERYLDRLFDLLAGTGAAGRRALAEADAHLQDSAEALRAGGLTAEDAETAAVARFGPAERYAREVLPGTVLPLRRVAGELVAAGWLLGGVGGVAVGLSGVLNWVIGRGFGTDLIAPDPPGATYSAARCAYLLEYYPASNCRSASIAHHFQEAWSRPIAAGVLALLALLALWLLRRTGRLRLLTTMPPASVVATAGCALFGAAGAVLLGQWLDALQLQQRWGSGALLAEGIAVLAVSPAFAFRLLAELRRGRPAAAGAGPGNGAGAGPGGGSTGGPAVRAG